MENSKALRSSLLASELPKTEDFALPSGQMIAIRQPTIGQRQKMSDRATKDGKFDGAKFRMLALIECATDKETGKPFLSESDLPALMEAPVRGTVDRLAEAVLEIMSADKAVKNSEAPVSASSSS